jgi:hypothetical protein
VNVTECRHAVLARHATAPRSNVLSSRRQVDRALQEREKHGRRANRQPHLDVDAIACYRHPDAVVRSVHTAVSRPLAMAELDSVWDDDEVESEYEKARRKNIEANARMLQSLGLDTTGAAVGA